MSEDHSETVRADPLKEAVLKIKAENPTYGKKRIFLILRQSGFPDVLDKDIKIILKAEV